MPRTTTLECPGCPRIRALAFDSLGLIKVIEARDKQKGVPKVVDRWGDPDSSKGVVSASINDSKSDPCGIRRHSSSSGFLLSYIQKMVKIRVRNDTLTTMYHDEKKGKRQVLIRPSSKVIIKFPMVMQKHGYIGEFEYVDDHTSDKILVELNGRLNKFGVISPHFDVGVKEIEGWTARLFPSRQFGCIVLTTSAGIMDHEEARCKYTGGKLLAVARKNGAIDVLNPLNGDLSFSIPNVGDAVGQQQQDDAVVGLHLFKKQKLDQATRSCTLLTCTTKGNASMRSFNLLDLHADTSCIGSPKTWKVCSSGNILCAKVDGSENHAVFGGKGVEVNVWDLENCTKVWTAKSPPKNNLGIFTPTWFTSATFMSHDDHRKFVTGTNDHQVRLYDISAQRRPVLSFDFRDTTIKSVAEDLDGHTIYVGNGSGDLASFDIRTGKLLGCFLGKCSGSIRSIARHPEHPVIASCGLDSYLRLWDIKSRQLLSAIFLKQHLTSVVFDSGFNEEEVPDVQAAEEIQNVEEIEELVASKRKKSKEKGSKKKSTEDKEGSKKLKAKKRRKKVQGDSSDDDDDL